MKKINQSHIILSLTALAFLLKAIQESNMIMGLIALLLMLLVISRKILFKKTMSYLESEETSKDFIQLYLEKDIDRYSEMLAVYKSGKCEVLYEERDGILLYAYEKDCYYASALHIEGAKDIIRKLPFEYNMFITYENLFEEISKLDFSYEEKIVEEKRIIYYQKKQGQ